MQKNYKNATIADSIGNLIGDNGIRTDVAVKLNPSSIPILIGAVTLSVIIGIIAANAIQGLFKK